MESYIVNPVEHAASLAGVDWDLANRLNDFSSPWDPVQKANLMFRALWDNRSLYIRYDVSDSEVFVFEKNGDKMEVASSERVEIFFRRDRHMSPYYCLEIDAKGRLLDYCAQYYRQFDNSWQWPADHINLNVQRHDAGYSVMVEISLLSLKEFGLIKNNEMEIGLFRGKCLLTNNSDHKITWITWIDPKTDEPDFHVKSSFGKLVLKENDKGSL